MRRIGLAPLLFVLAGGTAAGEPRPDLTPSVGAQLDLALPLTDDADMTTPLGAFVDGRPSLVLFGYHRCPNLCGVAELEMARALTDTGLSPTSYSVLFVSIDPKESAFDARAARDKLAEADPKADLTPWHFLTATPAVLATIERSVGLSVDPREESGLYIHPIVAPVFTPGGRLSRTFPGLDYAPRDLRLALIEASEGKLGTLGDHLLLLCSGFNPETGHFTGAIMLSLQVACLAALLLLAGLLVRLERSRSA